MNIDWMRTVTCTCLDACTCIEQNHCQGAHTEHKWEQQHCSKKYVGIFVFLVKFISQASWIQPIRLSCNTNRQLESHTILKGFLCSCSLQTLVALRSRRSYIHCSYVHVDTLQLKNKFTLYNAVDSIHIVKLKCYGHLTSWLKQLRMCTTTGPVVNTRTCRYVCTCSCIFIRTCRCKCTCNWCIFCNFLRF